MKNSNEFILLQNLIKEKKIEIVFKKTLKDTFGVWLYWYSEKKLKFKGFWYLYWLISSEWLWIPLSIFISIKISYFYLLLILVPFVITRIFKPIGEGFLSYEAKKDEVLFQELWDNKFIGIFSKSRDKSVIHKEGTPVFMIDSLNKDWKSEITKYENIQ